MTQLREELIGASACNDVVAHRYSDDGRCGDVAVITGDDAGYPLVHDRQRPLHLVQHMFRLDLGERTQRVGALEIDDESQRGVESVGPAEPDHRGSDS